MTTQLKLAIIDKDGTDVSKTRRTGGPSRQRKAREFYLCGNEGDSPATPPLKWAGGKRWLVPELHALWKRHSLKRWVEPFCGGLGAVIGVRPRRALLNDVNPHLINFYQQVKAGLEFDERFRNRETTFYSKRDRFNDLLTSGAANSPEAARLFYYLNRTGYNGLCRFNKKGKFNVPFGRYATIGYRISFLDYKSMFENWEFVTGDFEKVELRPNDFIYADPPYDVEFTQYSRGGFGWDEQRRTVKWLVEHSGPVVLSNQATDRILELYEEFGFLVKPLDAPRRISCTGDRSPAPEVIAVRNISVPAGSGWFRSLLRNVAY